MKNKFVFIVPSFNNEEWYSKNLNSIFYQSYTDWRIIYINDCSTDNTFDLVKAFINRSGFDNKCNFIENSTNLGPAASRYLAYQQTDDDEICCMLDGDDFLKNPNVLSKLDYYYNQGYNATYGSYYSLINGKVDGFLSPVKYIVPNFLISDIPYRKRQDWFSMHLRTMKSYLIKSIPKYHLQINNEWIKCCSDMAESYYILENLNTKIIKIDQPLYIYNRDNSSRYPLSYYRSDPDIVPYKNMVYNYIKNLT